MPSQQETTVSLYHQEVQGFQTGAPILLPHISRSHNFLLVHLQAQCQLLFANLLFHLQGVGESTQSNRDSIPTANGIQQEHVQGGDAWPKIHGRRSSLSFL